MDSWVKGGLARLERYRARSRLFIELYPATLPKVASSREATRCLRAGMNTLVYAHARDNSKSQRRARE
jgi:hypothetical protein